MAMSILILIAVIEPRKVRILVYDLTLVCKVFVYLLWITNYALLIWVLRKILQILLLLLRNNMCHCVPCILALVRQL